MTDSYLFLKLIALSVCISVILSIPSAILAATITPKVCVKWDIDYADASSTVGDDYFYNNGNDRRAYGVYLVVQENGITRWGPAFTDNTGCTSAITLQTGSTYLIRAFASAKIYNGSLQHLIVKDYNYDVVLDWNQSHSGWSDSTDKNIIFGPDEGTNVMAAASWALYRHAAGVSSPVYTYLIGSPWCKFSSPDIYLTDDCTDYKYIISHELGHAILRAKKGLYSYPEYTFNSVDLDCSCVTASDHKLDSLEYQSAALNEGWAQFYAATIWNNHSTETDCKFKYYKTVDFNGDGIEESRPVIDCEVANFSEGLPPYGWEKNYCTDQAVGKGNERDWLVMFWDLASDLAISVTTVAQVLVDMPTNWHADEDHLVEEMLNAADGLGICDASFGWRCYISGVCSGTNDCP